MFDNFGKNSQVSHANTFCMAKEINFLQLYHTIVHFCQYLLQFLFQCDSVYIFTNKIHCTIQQLFF